MASFRDILDLLVDGESVSAATANRPLAQLQANCVYLRDLLASTLNAQALYARSVTLDSTLNVSQPVYWNSGSGRFEAAQADGSAKQAFAGVVKSKASPTSGDLLVLGYDVLDLTNSLDGAGLAAGRYYLKTASAGKLQASKPDPAVAVLLANGAGGVFVLPPSQTLAAASLTGSSGTSTDAFVGVYDSGVLAGTLQLEGTVKNTHGSNGLTVRQTWTDAFGVTSNTDTNVAFGTVLALDSAVTHTGAYPPYTRIQLLVKAQSSGNQATYAFNLSRTI